VPCQTFQGKPFAGGNHAQSSELTLHPLRFSLAPSLQCCVHRGKGHRQLWLLAVKICAKSQPAKVKKDCTPDGHEVRVPPTQRSLRCQGGVEICYWWPPLSADRLLTCPYRLPVPWGITLC